MDYKEMSPEEKTFIELYSFQQKKYSEIEQKMNITRKEVQVLYDHLNAAGIIQQIQSVRNKFTEKRKENFRDFKEFYNWFTSQEKKCGYCGISQSELDVIFKEEMILPLNDAQKRSSGTLEIERKDSSDDYKKTNIILTCPLCNNAKSNLIDETNWRKIFVKPMRQYYELLLGTKLKNTIPEYHL